MFQSWGDRHDDKIQYRGNQDAECGKEWGFLVPSAEHWIVSDFLETFSKLLLGQSLLISSLSQAVGARANWVGQSPKTEGGQSRVGSPQILEQMWRSVIDNHCLQHVFERQAFSKKHGNRNWNSLKTVCKSQTCERCRGRSSRYCRIFWCKMFAVKSRQEDCRYQRKLWTGVGLTGPEKRGYSPTVDPQQWENTLHSWTVL